MSLADIYASSVRKNLKLFANWPIGEDRSLGDYGYLAGDLFVKEGNIFEEDLFGIPLEDVASPTAISFRFKSDGISIARLGAGASAVDPQTGIGGKAGIKIDFQQGDSVYFRSIKLQHHSIKHISRLNKAIMEQFAQGRWEARRVLVQSLFHSDGTTVVISSNSNASIEIEAQVDTGDAFDLADADAGLLVKSERNVGLTALAVSNLKPLLSLSQVRPTNRWWSWLGWSNRAIRPLGYAPESHGIQIEKNSLPENPPLDPSLADDLGVDVDDLFQVVELE